MPKEKVSKLNMKIKTWLNLVSIIYCNSIRIFCIVYQLQFFSWIVSGDLWVNAWMRFLTREIYREAKCYRSESLANIVEFSALQARGWRQSASCCSENQWIGMMRSHWCWRHGYMSVTRRNKQIQHRNRSQKESYNPLIKLTFVLSIIHSRYRSRVITVHSNPQFNGPGNIYFSSFRTFYGRYFFNIHISEIYAMQIE